MLNKFATLWANGELPQWYHMVTSTVKLVALIKPKDKAPTPEQSYSTTWWGSVRYAEVLNATAEDELEADETLEKEEPDGRPVGMGDLLRRLIEKAVVRAHAEAYRDFFWPQQVGLGVRGGAGLIVTAVRELLRRNPSFIVVRLDLKNAYNEMQRKAMLDAVERNPSLRHLYQLLYASMYHRSRVYLGDANTRADFDSEEGGQQGSPPVSAAFCAAIHPALVALDEALTTAGGAARSVMDDVYAVAPPTIEDERGWWKYAMSDQCTYKLVIHIARSPGSFYIELFYRIDTCCGSPLVVLVFYLGAGACWCYITSHSHPGFWLVLFFGACSQANMEHYVQLAVNWPTAYCGLLVRGWSEAAQQRAERHIQM